MAIVKCGWCLGTGKEPRTARGANFQCTLCAGSKTGPAGDVGKTAALVHGRRRVAEVEQRELRLVLAIDDLGAVARDTEHGVRS